MTLKAYSPQFSIARFILIVCVVYVHVPLPEIGPGMSDYDLLLPIRIASETLFRFSVLALTAISGFLFFFTNADQTPRATIIKKIKTLLIPFAFWNFSLVFVMWAGQTTGLISGTRINLADGDARVWMNALFALEGRPVNYPLYFLRDLFIISCLAVSGGRIFRKAPLAFFCLTALIAEYNLDGPLILRSPMLPCFVLGAVIARWGASLNSIKEQTVPFSISLILACSVKYVYPSQIASYYVAVLGTCTVWIISGKLAESRYCESLVKLSRYSFPIFLMHGGMLFLAIEMGLDVQPNVNGILQWIVVPPFLIVLCVIAFSIGSQIAPSAFSFVTGGRSHTKGGGSKETLFS